MKAHSNFWNQWFKDKTGRVAILQRPNLPLVVWVISFLLTKLLPYGQLNFVAALVSYGASFAWAWMELFYSEVYIRRAIGLAVLIIIVLSRIM